MRTAATVRMASTGYQKGSPVFRPYTRDTYSAATCTWLFPDQPGTRLGMQVGMTGNGLLKPT
jgi:hypothetical protein